jgi:hypothetical protein
MIIGTGVQIGANINIGDEAELRNETVVPADDTQASYCVEPGRWWIINANVFHSVTGFESGRTRFSVTGKIF